MSKTREPYLRFPHSRALRARMEHVLDDIDSSADPTAHREALAKLILDLTDEGMHFFFLIPVKELDLGVALESSAVMTVNGAIGVMGPLVRTIVNRMDAPRLRYVSRYIRDVMS